MSSIFCLDTAYVFSSSTSICEFDRLAYMCDIFLGISNMKFHTILKEGTNFGRILSFINALMKVDNVNNHNKLFLKTILHKIFIHYF